MSDAKIREFLAMLDDPDKATRTHAAEALAAMGAEVVPYLRTILMAERPDADHAEYAVWILEQIDAPEADELLECWWDRA